MTPAASKLSSGCRHNIPFVLSAARGNAAEAAILAAFIKHDYFVLVPFGDGQPYDLVVDVGGPLLRVQCKRAWGDRGCLAFNTHSTDHGKGRQSYAGRADISASTSHPWMRSI
jgi:PD-(D/E)XK endonuclease